MTALEREMAAEIAHLKSEVQRLTVDLAAKRAELNEQTKLSDADMLRVTNLQLRQQLIDKDRVILALEQRLLQAALHTTYGNPGEAMEVAQDGTIVRAPKVPT